MTTTKDAIVLERSLAAPPRQVWQMWTDPDQFARWYGPGGATVTVLALDPVVGGTRHVAMAMDTPQGPSTMWLVGEHTVVDEPDRLAYTESMSDADGNVLDPADLGMPVDHPRVTEVTVELHPEDAGTRLVLTHAGVPSDSPGATGWNTALDTLAETLAA